MISPELQAHYASLGLVRTTPWWARLVNWIAGEALCTETWTRRTEGEP